MGGRENICSKTNLQVHSPASTGAVAVGARDDDVAVGLLDSESVPSMCVFARRSFVPVILVDLRRAVQRGACELVGTVRISSVKHLAIGLLARRSFGRGADDTSRMFPGKNPVSRTAAWSAR